MKKHSKRLVMALLVILVVIGFGAVSAGAKAQFRSSSNFMLPYEALSNGATAMSSANFAIQGTTGQIAIGPGVSPHFRIGVGYGYSAEETYYRVYLPMGMRFGTP